MTAASRRSERAVPLTKGQPNEEESERTCLGRPGSRGGDRSGRMRHLPSGHGLGREPPALHRRYPVPSRPEVVGDLPPVRAGLRSPAGLGRRPGPLRPPVSGPVQMELRPGTLRSPVPPGHAVRAPGGSLCAPALGLALPAGHALGPGRAPLRAVVRSGRRPPVTSKGEPKSRRWLGPGPRIVRPKLWSGPGDVLRCSGLGVTVPQDSGGWVILRLIPRSGRRGPRAIVMV